MINFRDVKSLIIGGLPAGYKKVEYIESTGTQYIDTGFMPDQDSKVVMDVQSVGLNTNDTGQSFFGARDGSNSRFFTFWHRTNQAYYMYYNNTSKSAASDRLTERMTVTMNKNSLSVGDSVQISIDYAEFDCAQNLYLFATNLDGTADYFGVNRLYSCHIYDNNVLVREFVPCINPDNEVGLYDLVTEQFYGNGGTGVFTAGNVVGGVVTKTVTIYPTSYELPDDDLGLLDFIGDNYCTAVSDNNDTTYIYGYGDVAYTLPCTSVCSRVTSASINARAYLGYGDDYGYEGTVACTITGIVTADGSVVVLSDEHYCNDGENTIALSDTILAEINSRGGVSAFVINVFIEEGLHGNDDWEVYEDSYLYELSMTITGDFRPSGVVTQIADASGRVLWSAVKKAAITITGYGHATYCYVTIDGVKYNTATTLEVPVGTVITCFVGDQGKNKKAYMDVNGVRVANATNGYSYNYTVVGNAAINLAMPRYTVATIQYQYGVLTITEIPEGQILFTISGDKCFADEGMTWGEYSYSEYNMPNGTPLYIRPTSGTSPVLYHATGTELVLNGSTVFANETIVAFGAYTFKSFD